VVWAFVPIAALLTIVPGAATAMVVRSSMRGGWRAGVATIAGNEIGVVAWALLSVLGISALVAASEVAFVVLKVTGAAVLVWLGIQSWRGSHTAVADRPTRRPLRDGIVTSLANPKLAVFFVALFPQFVDPGASVLWPTLFMATLVVVFDFVWYTALAVITSRAKEGFTQTRLARRLEQVMGTVLIALGVRVVLEQR
jgi:threonine/homoserine/homoserine lactone efflux protein